MGLRATQRERSWVMRIEPDACSSSHSHSGRRRETSSPSRYGGAPRVNTDGGHVLTGRAAGDGHRAAQATNARATAAPTKPAFDAAANVPTKTMEGL